MREKYRKQFPCSVFVSRYCVSSDQLCYPADEKHVSSTFERALYYHAVGTTSKHLSIFNGFEREVLERVDRASMLNM